VIGNRESERIERAMRWALAELAAIVPEIKKKPPHPPEVARTAARKLNVEARLEDEHYGQGWASFREAFFYRDGAGFAAKRFRAGEQAFNGVAVLLCSFAPVYIMHESNKSWSARGSASSSLGSFDSIDHFPTAVVRDLAGKLEHALCAQGLTRLRKADVAEPTPTHLVFESNPTSATHRLFDALFFWND
jgi:hypothetical protein